MGFGDLERYFGVKDLDFDRYLGGVFDFVRDLDRYGGFLYGDFDRLGDLERDFVFDLGV